MSARSTSSWLPPGHEAVGQFGGGAGGLGGDMHVVMVLVRPFDAPKHHRGHLGGGLVDRDPLKTALEGGVLFDIFLVFAPGGGRHRAQLAARKGRLEQVGGVARPGLSAGPDERVGFVDEEDGRAGGLANLLDDGLEAALELALHAGARLQEAEVEGADLHLGEASRHVPGGDPPGKPLHDGRLAHAGLPDENRVVFAAPAQHVDDLADLGVPRIDRVDRAGAGLLRQVFGVLLQRGGSVLAGRGRPLGGAAPGPDARRPVFDGSGHDVGEVAAQNGGIDRVQRFGHRAGAEGGVLAQGFQQKAGSNLRRVVVNRPQHEGGLDDLQQVRREGRAPGVAGPKPVEAHEQGLPQRPVVDVEATYNAGEVAGAVFHQLQQEMVERHLVMHPRGAEAGRRLQGARAVIVQLRK